MILHACWCSIIQRYKSVEGLRVDQTEPSNTNTNTNTTTNTNTKFIQDPNISSVDFAIHIWDEENIKQNTIRHTHI